MSHEQQDAGAGCPTREEWRPVVDAPGYEVSDLGRVRTLKGDLPTVMKPSQRNGYPKVHLWVGGKKVTRTVHVLVMAAFGPPRPPGHQIRHRNGNRTDCRAENLLWGTAADNAADRDAHGNTLRGDNAPWSKLRRWMVVLARLAATRGSCSVSDFAAVFSVNHHTLQEAVNGRTWRHVRWPRPVRHRRRAKGV